MKKNKILFYILIYTMIVGGIMGIIKGLVPHMTWFSFRHLLGMDGTFKDDAIPTYAVIYGVFMAVLEIISAILLLTPLSAESFLFNLRRLRIWPLRASRCCAA